VRASNDEVDRDFEVLGWKVGIQKMRFSLAIAIILAGISVSGVAQQNSAFKVKHAPPEKAPKQSVPVGKMGNPATASAANSKDLHNIENQSVKNSAPPKSAVKKAPGSASTLKPVKDKPNPPINFNGTGGAKSAGMANQGSNPYKGRLRQKHARQQ
jgi:hypothetical protein